jgi:hypothetical protein
MDIEKEILDSIFTQLNFNRKKNLFFNGSENDFVTLSESTIDFIKNRKVDILGYFETLFARRQDISIINKIVDSVLQTFYDANQYLYFSNEDISELKSYYFMLLNNIYSYLLNDKENCIDDIIHAHYNNLKRWISKTNPFVKIINKNDPYVPSIVCSEYSPEMQLSILDISLEELKEPVIDIGCGYNARLVSFLRNKGILAFGLDRIIKENKDYLITGDWFSFPFVPDSWGSIIAHMSFSNHFMHNHLRSDGDYSGYANKYTQILKSLSQGGCFIYTPSLPFIEEFIDEKHFSLTKKNFDKLSINDYNLGLTIITKIA